MSAEGCAVPPLLTLVHAELLKISTTRMPWLLGLTTELATVVLALQPIARAGRDGTPSVGTIGAALGVLDAMGQGALGALLVGVLVATSDFRHQSIGAFLLPAPDRLRLLVAKVLTALLLGLGLGLLSLVAVSVLGALSGAWAGGLVNAPVAVRGMGLLLTYPLYAVLGTAVGALLRSNQPLAVVLPLVWVWGIEPLALSGLPASALRWSIGGVTAALQNAGNLPFLLPVWAGGAALIGYSSLLLVVAAFRLHRSDIT
jgi:ABC-2 type transport system permease protein